MKLRHITGANSPCPKVSKKVLPRDLNYPSLTAMVSPSKSFNVSFHRIVTNVGFANSTYKDTTFTNSKVKVVVEPEVLSLKSLHEKSLLWCLLPKDKEFCQLISQWHPHHWYGLMEFIV